MTCPAGRWSKTSSTPLRSPRSRPRASAMAERTVLVINSGSSSLKFQLVQPDSGATRAGGVIGEIGEPSGRGADHEEALRLAFHQLAEDGIDLKSCGLLA